MGPARFHCATLLYEISLLLRHITFRPQGLYEILVSSVFWGTGTDEMVHKVTAKLVGNAVNEHINKFRNHELPLDVYSRMYAH